MYEKSLVVFCELKKLQQGLIIFYFTVVIGMWIMQRILGRGNVTSNMLTSMLKYSL